MPGPATSYRPKPVHYGERSMACQVVCTGGRCPTVEPAAFARDPVAGIIGGKTACQLRLTNRAMKYFIPSPSRNVPLIDTSLGPWLPVLTASR